MFIVELMEHSTVLILHSPARTCCHLTYFAVVCSSLAAIECSSMSFFQSFSSTLMSGIIMTLLISCPGDMSLFFPCLQPLFQAVAMVILYEMNQKVTLLLWPLNISGVKFRNM